MTWKQWHPPSVETDTVKVGTAITKLAKSLGLSDPKQSSSLVADWEKIAGPEIASEVQPQRIENNVLVVRIENQTWKASFKWMAPTLLEAVQKHPSGREISSIKAI